MRQRIVALQAAGGIPPAGPAEIAKAVLQRQAGGGDGGGQHQRMHQPGNDGEQTEQGEREIKSDDADGGPQRGHDPLDNEHKSRRPDAAHQARIAPKPGVSRPASRVYGLGR